MTNKEAIEHLNNKLNIAYFTAEDNEALDMAIKALEERSAGEWIKEEYFRGHYYEYKCSICGVQITANTKYCPYCGAKMKGAEE